FYLWMSLGGVLGGLFNALAAPMIFKDLTEYPLAIVVGCFLVPAVESDPKKEGRSRVLDVLVPLCLFGVMLSLQLVRTDSPALIVAAGKLSDWTNNKLNLSPESLWVMLVLMLPALAVYYGVDRPLRYGLGVLAFGPPARSATTAAAATLSSIRTAAFSGGCKSNSST